MRTAIILGAGPAGLTAAFELLTRTDIRPVILEMDRQVGGLSRTINHNGNGIDIGGHRFFSRSEDIIRWWLDKVPLDPSVPHTRLDLGYHEQSATFSVPADSDGPQGKMLLRQRKSRIFFNGTFLDYPLRLDRRTLGNFGLAQLALITASYARAKLFPRKEEKSLEDFFINRFGRKLYRIFFKGYTEKVWGSPCTAIPADWGRQRIKDLNVGKAVGQLLRSLLLPDRGLRQQNVSTSLIEQFLYPEKGPGQLWEAVAARILALGGEIRFGATVSNILTSGNRVTAVEYTGGNSEPPGTRVEGDFFFSSIPVRKLVAGMAGAAATEAGRIAAQLAYRDFMMVGLLFEKLPGPAGGRLEGITDNWIYLQDAAVRAGRLQVFNNWSEGMVADPGTLWLGLEYFCSDQEPLWQLPDETIIRQAHGEVTQTGLIGREKLLDAVVIRVPKAYPSYTGAYNEFGVVRDFLDGFPNLFPIGRNGMHRYNNSDHSMMTAMTAVDNIISGRTDKSNLWAVNMEPDFHEEK